jgi:beta-1,4-mannosyltransferase
MGERLVLRQAALTIHARPAWRGENPFIRLLSGALERQGLNVAEVQQTRRAFPRRGLLLLHWPDEFYRTRGGMRAAVSAAAALAKLWFWSQIGGLRIVWLAHNIVPHDSRGSPPAWTWDPFLRLLDGIVTMSHDSAMRVVETYPALRHRPLLVTRHGHYLDVALSPPSVRASMTDQAPIRLGAFGHIRAYKRPAALIAAVAAQEDEDLVLDMRGACLDVSLGRELTALAAGRPVIRLFIGSLSDAALEQATDSVDAIVLPYERTLNSGAVFYALSRFRPVIAPALPGLREIQAIVGKEWLFLFDGDFDAATLHHAKHWLRAAPRSAAPDLSAFDWDIIGEELATFLRRIGSSGQIDG